MSAPPLAVDDDDRSAIELALSRTKCATPADRRVGLAAIIQARTVRGSRIRMYAAVARKAIVAARKRKEQK